MSKKTEAVQRTMDNDTILHCTVGLYKLFLAGGREGLEAFRLYMHLQFAAIHQGTQSVRANLKYLNRGTGFGEKKLKTLKKWLLLRGLITYERSRDQTGKYDEWRIRVNFLWSSERLMKYVEAITTRDSQEEDEMQLQLVDNPVDNPDLSSGANLTPVEEDIAK